MSPFNEKSTASGVATVLSSHITGKTILITGASPNGLGATAAFAIAPHNPSLLILAGRSLSSIQETETAILAKTPDAKIRLLIFDLADLHSVRKAAEEMNEYKEDIDVLINNAGIMALPEREETKDGFERQLGVNHLGPFLFTNLILGKVKNGGRIVNVSSGGHLSSGVRFDDPNFETPGSYEKWAAYGQSKTANILFAQSLAEKLGEKKGIFAFSLHVGGGIFTNLGKHLTPEDLEGLKTMGVKIFTHDEGTATYIAAAFDPELEASNGAYLGFCKVALPEERAEWAQGKENADKLWALSEKLVGEKFDI